MLQTDSNPGTPSILSTDNRLKKLRQFMGIAAMLAVITVINVFLEHYIHPSSLVFVYLVAAIAGAVYYGVWASVLSFVAGFLIFDFFFVEPYYSLHISKPQDIYNVTVYFGVAALMTYLIHLVRRQNAFLRGRLARLAMIEDMSRDFLLLVPIERQTPDLRPTEDLQAMVFSQLGQLVLKYTKMVLDVPAVIFFQEEDGRLKLRAKSNVDLELTPTDHEAACWTATNGEVSGFGTYTFPNIPYYFMPLTSLKDVIGVIGVVYNSKDLFPEERRLLGTISHLTTMVASSWMNLKASKPS